jgi:uncharacterized protein YqjF (DUF2071 family)
MSRFLTASWKTLVMLNYRIAGEVLRPLAPPGTELDPFEGHHYVSVVGFQFTDTRVRGWSVPWHRHFEEINLRFYIRRRTAEGWRRAVAFVKEVVPRWAIASVAKWLYNENYVCCPMTASVALPSPDHPGHATYRWKVQEEWFEVGATFEGEPQRPEAGSEEEYITEHYWGYVTQSNGGLMEYQVEHPPWRVWRATGWTLKCDVARFYGPAFAEVLKGEPASAFVAEGSPIIVYRGIRLPAAA